MINLMVSIQTLAEVNIATYTDGHIIVLTGILTPGDILPRMYYYDTNSLLVGDDNWVIHPALVIGAGRLLKIHLEESLIDATISPYTEANLNSLYPNLPIGYKVICPVINTVYERYSSVNWYNQSMSINNETDPLFNSKFATKTTSDLAEGTNLYYTNSRFNTSLASKSTSDLVEGSNLYYTNSRFNTSFSTKSTTDLTEGTNLYYTTARFNSAFSGKTTSDLTEGTNLYYTTTRFNTAFSGKSTTDLVEGTQLYYTNARARLSISGGTGISYNNSTGVITNSSPDQTVVLTGSNGITTSGTYPNFTISKTKKQETYTGTTSGSGTYTVVYSTPYSVTPNLQVTLVASGAVTNFYKLTASSATGFTVTTYNTVNVLGLLPTYPTLNGLVVDVLVTEK